MAKTPTKKELLERLAEREAELAALKAAEKASVGGPRGVVEVLKGEGLHEHEQEHFAVVCVDSRLRPLKVEVIAKGTVNEVMVHPRDVFRAAVRANAYGVILAHNHPSGDPRPGGEDLTLTSRMLKAGKVLGIPVLDHIVLGRGGDWHAMAESGVLDFHS